MDFRENLHVFVLSLIGRYLHRGLQGGWIRLDTDDPRAGWPAELRDLFDRKSRSLFPLRQDVVDELSDWRGIDFNQFWGNLVQMSCEGNPLANRWYDFVQALDLHPSEISLLAVLVAIEFDIQLMRALLFAMSDINLSHPRWGFLVRFLATNDDEVDLCSALLHPDKSRLFLDRVVRLGGYPRDLTSSREVLLYAPAASYLMGFEIQKREFELSVDMATFDDEIHLQIEKIKKSEIQPTRFIIEGAVGSGKRHVARGLAFALGFSGIWTLDLMPFTVMDDALAKINDARAMATLHNAMIVIPDVSNWVDRWNDATRRVITLIEDSGQPVVWLISGDMPQILHVEPEAHIRISMPNRKQREAVWRHLMGDDFGDRWISQLAGQFLLTRGQIETAVHNASAFDADNEEARYKLLADQARVLSKEGLGSLATPEPARVSFDQLIVSDECRTALEDLLMYAKHRQGLAKEWGFERSMPYGLGLAALFSGPPGTGKTYGAQVIATELQLELYRVDLSQLVSKYIGETEKHLAELFNVAEQGEVLLLFDEADSVFGKRTEVKTSVDRYANLEINYLLQRLERFTGVSILTSNFDSAIDEAFMRRIRFKVPFELPAKESRLVLWKKFLSPAIPRARDVNLDVLAETFELSGGHIKEAVLRAASIAYGSKKKRVTQELLIRSAELEYKKLGKLMPQSLGDDDDDRFSRW